MAIERRRVPGTLVLVEKYRIAGTDMIVYRAWEPTAGLRRVQGNGHSTLTYFTADEVPEHGMHVGWYGDVATRDLPPHLEALPAYTDERYTRVTEWQHGQYECAYNLITAAFPEAAAGMRRYGEIETRVA